MTSQVKLAPEREAALRESVSLDGLWQFRFEEGPSRPIVVPAAWQAQIPDLVHSTGRATYVRSFDLPAAWQDREIVLKFGAVSYYCEVLLNGAPVGANEGGYLPFAIALPKDRLAARNTIEVRVTLPSGDRDAFPEFPFAEIPHGKQSWYGPLGGIWQSVALEARDPRHVTHVAIAADPKSGTVSVNLEASRAAKGSTAVLSVRDPDGAGVTTGDATIGAETTATLTVQDPALWSLDAPNLYELEVAVQADGKTVDAVTETFGFRTVETRDGAILLNGEPVYMRGALDQDYYPEGICTPPSLEFLEDQARKAKAMGLNTLRCHIKVPDPRYYEVADRFGLLVWTEIPNAAVVTEKAAQRLRDTMAGILRRDGNHPSIIAWTIVNEDWGTRLLENADHRAWLKDMFDWLKKADPTRLVVDNSACFPNFHLKTDINDYHYYRSVPERRGEWDAITEQFAAGADWTFSPHGDAERRGDEPLIVSEFGVWGLPHPDKVRGARGEEPFWFESGGNWGAGAAYPHGIENRVTALGLDAVFGGFDAFIEAVQWYQFANLKYEIEVMRSHAAISGYVITELTDVHWEANGLMDIARNPRVFADAFAAINADTVILPRVERYAGYSGETLDVALGVATGGKTIPQGARLSWSGDATGACDVPATGAMQHADLGTQGLVLPEIGENRTGRIDFVLEANGTVLAENSLEFGLYARRDTTSLPKIACADAGLAEFAKGLGYTVTDTANAAFTLAHALDTGDIEAMRAGARYLVLADGSVATNGNLRTDVPEGEKPYRAAEFAGHPLGVGTEQSLPGIGLVERDGTMWRGDWIANFGWIARTGAFAKLPGGPLMDLSFSGVVPHHVMTGMREWEYAGGVIGGVVIGWVQRPAATIFRRNVGEGGVLATTFRLKEEAPGADPVAAAMFDALATTAAGLPGTD